MAAVDDLDEVLEQFHLAQGELLKGNPEPAKNMCSQREDATLNNPLSPPAHGWEQVAATVERAASQVRDGEFVSAEIIEKNVTAELAYVVQIERGEAKIGGRDDLSTRRWHLEDSASARRSHNYGASSRVGDTGIALP
jgi:hypothetical protein